MDALLLEYLPILIFFAIAAVIGIGFMVAAFVIAPSRPDPEKVSTYECGFNAFDDARMKFDVRFYLVAILFIIFDLEVAFLFPWAVTLREHGVARCQELSCASAFAVRVRLQSLFAECGFYVP